MADIEPPAGAHPISGRFLSNINYVFVSSLTSNTVGFLLVILLARALGPEGRGEMAIYQAGVTIGYALFNLGIGPAVFYFAARKELTPRQAMETGLTITLGAALLTALAVVVIALAFSSRLEGRDLPYALAILTVPSLIQLRVTESLLRAQGRFGALNAMVLALPLLMIGVFGGVEVLVGLTVQRAVWIWSIVYLPVIAGGYALLGPAAWPRALAGYQMIRRTVAFGGQSQVGTLIEMVNYRVDVFLILVLVNTAGVGLYTVATSQTEGLWIIANSVGIVLLTNITSGDAANAARMTPVVCRNTLLVTSVAAAGAAVIAALWIPVVFGSGYRESVLPYLWLLPGTAAYSGTKVLASYVFSRGRPMINALISLITFVVTVPVEVVLIELFGVPGAAVATTTGYCLSLALTAIAYRRLSGGSIREALIPRRSDVALYTDALRTAKRKLRRGRAPELQTSPE